MAASVLTSCDVAALIVPGVPLKVPGWWAHYLNPTDAGGGGGGVRMQWEDGLCSDTKGGRVRWSLTPREVG